MASGESESMQWEKNELQQFGVFADWVETTGLPNGVLEDEPWVNFIRELRPVLAAVDAATTPDELAEARDRLRQLIDKYRLGYTLWTTCVDYFPVLEDVLDIVDPAIEAPAGEAAARGKGPAEPPAKGLPPAFSDEWDEWEDEEVEEAARGDEPEELGFAEDVAPPPRRYTDFAFFPEAHGQRAGEPLPQGHVLQEKQWYQLEVAVREKPRDLIPVTREGGEERQPLPEPKQDEPVTLYVTAEGSGFEIEEPVQTLVLPPKRGDSTRHAYFRVRPGRPAAGPPWPTIRLRIYYQFNLLEVVDVRAEVVGQFDDPTHSHSGQEQPIAAEQQRLEGNYVDLEHVLPRAMHIDITREQDTFLLHFTFHNDVEDEVEFTAPARLTKEELESIIVDLRKALLGIAMSASYGEAVEGDKFEFTQQMHKLARLGRKLWIKLFRADRDSALWHVGEWLETHPIQRDAIIQISTSRDAASFVFPWNLLFDGNPRTDDLGELLDGFWGLRYVVEQRLPDLVAAGDQPVALSDGLDLGFLLWPFKQKQAQIQFVEELLTKSGGRLATGAPIERANDAFTLFSDCGSHILYFFSHGYTRLRSADIGGLTLDDFVKLYETLPDDSPLREEWKGPYRDITKRQYDMDDSWIGLGVPTTKLYLDDLYDMDEINLSRTHPIVFLNMCESAQVTPSLGDSFIHFFIDRGARCVIGTECSMRPLFAHLFSQAFLGTLLRGVPAGRALLQARRAFVDQYNPLGLAYTLFGSATARFEPAPLPLEE